MSIADEQKRLRLTATLTSINRVAAKLQLTSSLMSRISRQEELTDMGKYPRQKQARLPEKLLKIRTALGLSQNEMLKRLNLEGKFSRTSISNYETGDREPPLLVLLRYARTAGICLDVIVDDELDLPTRLPAVAKHTKMRTKHSITKKR